MDAVGLNVICMHFETKLLNSCVLFKPALQYKKCPTFTPSLPHSYLLWSLTLQKINAYQMDCSHTTSFCNHQSNAQII